MIRTARRLSLALLLLPALLAPSQARAAATDLQYAPATSSGHDFNHAPIGQSFQALAAQVRAGVFSPTRTATPTGSRRAIQARSRRDRTRMPSRAACASASS